MFWRENGNSGDRLDKNRDSVFADSVGQTTAWLPIQHHQALSIQVCAARLKPADFSPPGNQQFDIVPTGQGAMSATVILEHKFGGQADETARMVEEFIDAPVATVSHHFTRGFVRLRLVELTSLDSGVYMSLTKHSPSV